MAEEEVLIRMTGIDKVYPAGDLLVHALSNVHLEIRRGEFVAVAGPSGSGKTTLLSLLGLLDTPSKGRYEFAGRSVEGLSERERARIRGRDMGFIFQSFNLISELSVFENVELPLVYSGVKSVGSRRRSVERVLDRFDLLHRARHMPSQLSGGQQQRVAVARAVVGEPQIVLADEPTGNLDSVNSELVMGLLRTLNGAGVTVCIVTHDPRHAGCAERTVSLFDGRVIGDGP